MKLNTGKADIFGWIMAFFITFGVPMIIFSFNPLAYTFIGLLGLFALSFPVLGVIKLFQETCKWSDKYTNLPKISSAKPLKSKVFILVFGLLLTFAALTVIEAIPFIYLKVIAILYSAWLFYILLGWLDKGGIKENADDLTTIASILAKGIGIVGGIYILLNLPNNVVLLLFFGPMVFGILLNLFSWIKNKKK